MKKNKEIMSIIIIIILLIYLLFNTHNINNNVIYATKLWFYKVFPFLFAMVIINELLLNNNILFYINQIFKKNGIKYYTFVMCLLSGSPTNSIIIKKLYNNKIIDLESANKMLLFTHFSNPIFLISMLNHLFDKKTAFVLILLHYIPNIIICLFIKINPLYNKILNSKTSFNNIINNAINTSLMVLGTLTVYITISNTIIDLFNIKGINSIILKGLLEMTQGLNEIPNIHLNNYIKQLLSVIFINFGGLSIHSQIKSIISDTSISYKYFLFGRLIQVMSITILIFWD